VRSWFGRPHLVLSCSFWRAPACSKLFLASVLADQGTRLSVFARPLFCVGSKRLKGQISLFVPGCGSVSYRHVLCTRQSDGFPALAYFRKSSNVYHNLPDGTFGGIEKFKYLQLVSCTEERSWATPTRAVRARLGPSQRHKSHTPALPAIIKTIVSWTQRYFLFLPVDFGSRQHTTAAKP